MNWRVMVMAVGLATGAQAQTILVEDFETPRLVSPFGNFSGDDVIGAFTVIDDGVVTLMRFDDRPGTNGVQAMAFRDVGNGGGEAGIYSLLTGLQPGERYVVSLDHSSLVLPEDQGMWGLSIHLEVGEESMVLDRRTGTHLYIPGGDNGYGTPTHPWVNWTVEFTALSAEATLWIVGSAGIGSRAGAYPVIDNVRVAMVPEPAVVMLLGPAAVLLAMGARRGRGRGGVERRR